MKRKALFPLMPIVLSLWFLQSAAQNNLSSRRHHPVRPVEAELFMGVTTPIGSYHSSQKGAGALLGLEVRHNIGDTPWDAGLLIDAGMANHKINDGEQKNRTISLALVGHYNFRQGGKVNPFVGLGVGFSNYHVVEDVINEEENDGLVFIPRVGVEMWGTLRLTGSLHISKRGYHYTSLSLGFVLGGKRRK